MDMFGCLLDDFTAYTLCIVNLATNSFHSYKIIRLCQTEYSYHHTESPKELAVQGPFTLVQTLGNLFSDVLGNC